MQHNGTYAQKGLTIFITTVVVALGLQPCLVAQTQSMTKSGGGNGGVPVICHLCTTDDEEELTKTISLADFQLLGTLLHDNQSAFLVQASRLGLCSPHQAAQLAALMKTPSTTDPMNAPGQDSENQWCRFTVNGSLTSLNYLPLPYVLYQFLLKYGIYLKASIIFLVMILYMLIIAAPQLITYYLLASFPILKTLFDHLLEKLQPLHQHLVAVIQYLDWWMQEKANQTKSLLTATWQTLGHLHTLTPVKIPLIPMIVANGTMMVNTTGTDGAWNHTGPTMLTLWGFCGLWLSFPSQGQPTGTPTWCLGIARCIRVE